ncbi:alkyl sulfatase YjcS [Maricurvus nonylphenolicus]|uniref:alkyl sulfatase dimerization domain-containing protein n=1 Tax=Maricurvus nonylphenolicus TaxID=1008307 RepID=UPI0036F21ACB
MLHLRKALFAGVVGLSTLGLVACKDTVSVDAPAAINYHVERSWPEHFEEHRKHFEPKVYQIGEHKLWSINNPDDWAANSILIEGETGLIVYDTGLSHEHGEAILAEVRKLSDKPITHIFYSHHHPDHYNGTSGLVSVDDVKAGKVKIYAWENFVEEMNSEWGATAPAQVIRSVYYLGIALPEEDAHYHGCCGEKYGGRAGYIPPTDTFSEDTHITLDGVEMNIFYTGGEAKSEFGLYLPAYKTAVVADELFHSVPNIYTIRGAKFREPEGYMRAVDAVLHYDVEYLLGTHLVPIVGKDNIRQQVIKFRDLVQWINDQSIRYINKGYGIEELKAKFTEVPEYLDNGAFSTEMYGSFRHIAPQMFTGLVGYFSGDAIEYRPTEPVELARRHIELMGGRDRVFNAAANAYNDGDSQFAAELLTYLIRVDNDDMEARHLKAAAFRKLGYAELNTTWRSWYLTSALELDGVMSPSMVVEEMKDAVFAKLESKPAVEIIGGLRFRVKAEEVGGDHLVINYNITDSNEQVSAELRNGVLVVKPELHPQPQAALTMTRETFNKLVKQELGPLEAIKDGVIDFEGNPLKLRAFGKAFDENPFMERLAVR